MYEIANRFLPENNAANSLIFVKNYNYKLLQL